MKAPPAFLRRLLALLPRRHRRLYRDEIWEVAEYRWRRAGGGVGATVAAGWDLATGVAGVWTDDLGRMTMEMLGGWTTDVKFVLRSLWKSRGYVATAVTVLACAVAANATVSSYVRGTLLAEPPYPDPASVAVLWGSNPENGKVRDVISGPNFIDLQERLGSVEALAAFHYDGTYMEVDGHPEVFGALEASVDFMRILDVQPAMGRLFDGSERYSGGAETVLVTHGFWRDRLGSDPDAVGSTLTLEGRPHTVLGVLPEDFAFVAPAPVVLPLHDDVLAADDRGRIHYHLLARLGPRATWADLRGELDAAAEAIRAEYAGFTGWSFRAERLDLATVEAVRPVILVLVATVALVLLIALTNLATLFRVRTSVRAQELGVRAALGAGRLRLVRVLALEPVILASAGAGIGLAVTPALLARVAELVPMWVTIPDSAARVPVVHATLDAGVVALALVATIVGALVLTGPSFVAVLRGRPRRGGTATDFSARVLQGFTGLRFMVGVEIAVTTVLLVGAGLLARSFDQMSRTEVGLDDDGLLTLSFADVWGLEPEARARYFREVTDAVGRVPGVRQAAVIDYVDFLAEDDFARIYLLDRNLQPRSDLREEWRRIDEDLFETAGMRIVRGRGFDRDDMTGVARTAVVNEAFAARHYPGVGAIGQLISTHDSAYRELRIVGVVADLRSLGPTNPPPPMLYVPNQGSARGTQGMYVRTEGEPMAYAGEVREAIWSVDPTQPVIDIQPMAALVDSWIAIPRAARALVTALAGLAWLLSTLGVFGVVAYAVRSRRSELGVRVALGASPARLERDQLLAASPMIVAGVGVGLILAVAAARGARALLYGVGPLDPPSLIAGVVATALAAALASWLPARRAGRADPRAILRAD